VEAAIRQPLSLPHLLLPLPLTKNEKTTVDLSRAKFAMDGSYAFSRSLVLLILHVHSDLVQLHRLIHIEKWTKLFRPVTLQVK